MIERIAVDRSVAFPWIAERRSLIAARDVADKFGCSYHTGRNVLAEFDYSEPSAGFSNIPLPRWTQPRRPQPHYFINDAYPADSEVTI